MAIRLRLINGQLIALCAAATRPMSGDRYLDDGEDHALRVKFRLDWETEGLIAPTIYSDGHPDENARRIIKVTERYVNTEKIHISGKEQKITPSMMEERGKLCTEDW